MTETLIALAVFGVLAATALLRAYVQWYILLRIGVWLVAGGLGLSISAGIVYHVALYRALFPRNALTHGWYWAPTRFHTALVGEERGWVLPWFYLGATGFSVAIFGCVAVLLAVLGTS